MDSSFLFDELFRTAQPHVKHTVWVFSDLQQSDPVNTEKCLRTALADIRDMALDLDQLWYLGDSVEGIDLDRLEKMAALQKEGFGSLGVPLYFVTGNHDYDYSSAHRDRAPLMPFYETVQKTDGWHTTASVEDFYFRGKLGDYDLFFISDHISKENKWRTSHGMIRYGEEDYPYTQKDWDDLRAEIASAGKNVITLSHYSYAGGNRAAAMLNRLFPLPDNVRLHLYGHAHIGDWVWAGKEACRRISGTDWHDIPQVCVTSLENIRAEFCRSVLFQIYDNDTFGIFFRDHDHHRFIEAFFPCRENEKNGYANKKD